LPFILWKRRRRILKNKISSDQSPFARPDSVEYHRRFPRFDRARASDMFCVSLMSTLSFGARPLDPRVARSSSSSNQKWRGKALRTGGHVTTTPARRRLQNANRNNENTHNQRGKLVIRNADLGGSYGDSFVDVDNLLVNYFTFKALKSSLAQMQETDLSPGKGEYKWLYNFASENYKNDGQKFIRALFAEGLRLFLCVFYVLISFFLSTSRTSGRSTRSRRTID
jgi:hypothetical protein